MINEKQKYHKPLKNSILFLCSNCSGSHQGTKTQRIDMSFTPLSEKEGGIARKTVHQKGY